MARIMTRDATNASSNCINCTKYISKQVVGLENATYNIDQKLDNVEVGNDFSSV